MASRIFRLHKLHLHETGAEEMRTNSEDVGSFSLILRKSAERDRFLGQREYRGLVFTCWACHAYHNEEIKHDLYIIELLRTHRNILETSFGPVLRDLRKQFGPSARVYRPKQKTGEDGSR